MKKISETTIRSLFLIFYPLITYMCFRDFPDKYLKSSIFSLITGFSLICLSALIVKYKKDNKGYKKLFLAFLLYYPATLFFTFCITYPIIFKLKNFFAPPTDILFCIGIFSCLGWHIDLLYNNGNIFDGIAKIISKIKNISNK